MMVKYCRMIELNESMVIILNIIAFLLAIYFVFQGFRKGFLRSVLSLVGTIVCCYLSWMLSEHLGNIFPIVQNTSTNPLIQQIGSEIYTFANRIIWFVIVFIVLRIICFVLDLILQSVHKIPGVHVVSSLLGMVFGLVETVVWILLLCIFIESPIFAHGSALVNESVLGAIKDLITPISQQIFEPVIKTDAYSKIIDDIDTVSEEKIESFKTWLEGQKSNYGN